MYASMLHVTRFRVLVDKPWMIYETPKGGLYGLWKHCEDSRDIWTLRESFPTAEQAFFAYNYFKTIRDQGHRYWGVSMTMKNDPEKHRNFDLSETDMLIVDMLKGEPMALDILADVVGRGG